MDFVIVMVPFIGGWVDEFHSILFDFTAATGMSMVELDGPYGGG